MAGERKSFALIGAPVMRLTKVDACGRPIYGDRARLITEGFVSVNASAQVEEGDEVSIPNANGRIMARRRAKPKHNGYITEIELIGVQPDAANFLAGAPLVVNGLGDIAGFDVDTDVDPSTVNVAIELWDETGDGEGCEDEGAGQLWGWNALPLNSGGTIGDVEFQNDAINFTVSNLSTKTGHQWGAGPYFVDFDVTGEPVQLAPIPGSVALRTLGVAMDPPEPSDGAIPLDDPTADPAETAVAGNPGNFTPVDSFRPESLEDLIAAGVTASPSTAWTSGQGVMLQNGTFAHWSGTAWVAGKAA